jgi:hypothetical protein
MMADERGISKELCDSHPQVKGGDEDVEIQ